MTETRQLQYIKGIGPRRVAVLAKMGIATVEDLLYYFPRRYEDRTHFTPLCRLQEAEVQTVRATLVAAGQHRSFYRKGFNITEVAASDQTGVIHCVWFNQPYLKKYFRVGQTVIFHGKVERYGGRLKMNNPDFELVTQGEDESLNMGRIVPVYPSVAGIGQRLFRKIIKHALDVSLPEVKDIVPYDVRQRNNLLNLSQSLHAIHFPDTLAVQQEAYTRLCFEEFFLYQLPLAVRKLRRREKKGIAHAVSGELVQRFIASLPYQFTPGQRSAIEEIKKDMSSPQVMQRLLQGDVGSGKTVVATVAALMAVQGAYQVAFMVPTEILARQHYEKIGAQLAAMASAGSQVRLRLLTGSTPAQERSQIVEELKKGQVDILVGTHALLEEKVSFHHLGLVIIDEQHKFGVGQRLLLPAKGRHPDVLIMTATPIPRTLAITIYADMDVSVIPDLPPGRAPITTLSFPLEKNEEGYALVKEQLRRGRQAFIVYPVIEESLALDIAGAKKMYEQYRQNEFKEFRLGLIHGKLKQSQQDETMRQFKEGRLDLIVSTTVLEVGIDIPNATCMVIWHAERFGLSQLHQLRGRVGRGTDASYCILISEGQTEQARSRIHAMVHYSDGFKIAEEDLKIRGPGEFFGSRQHGLTELKIGNPLVQLQLLKKARDEAVKIVEEDPSLSGPHLVLLKERLLKRFPGYENLMMVG